MFKGLTKGFGRIKQSRRSTYHTICSDDEEEEFQKLKWTKPGLFSVYFSLFSKYKYSTNLSINYKSIDGVYGT